MLHQQTLSMVGCRQGCISGGLEAMACDSSHAMIPPFACSTVQYSNCRRVSQTSALASERSLLMRVPRGPSNVPQGLRSGMQAIEITTKPCTMACTLCKAEAATTTLTSGCLLVLPCHRVCQQHLRQVGGVALKTIYGLLACPADSYQLFVMFSWLTTRTYKSGIDCSTCSSKKTSKILSAHNSWMHELYSLMLGVRLGPCSTRLQHRQLHSAPSTHCALGHLVTY
jgi:hypothetical protein